jgi:hypothetical protein
MSLDYRPMLLSHQLFRETVPLNLKIRTILELDKYALEATTFVIVQHKSVEKLHHFHTAFNLAPSTNLDNALASAPTI